MCRLLVAEPRGDIGVQARLVVLDEEDVVAPLLDDLLAEVALTEDGVADDDPIPNGQQSQQFQGRLVLVGLGIDAHLNEDRFDQRRVGGDQMLSGRLAVAAAPQGLAVERNRLFLPRRPGGGRRRPRPDPAREGGLEGGRVEATEQAGQAGGGGGLAAGEAQGVGQGRAVVAAELGDGLQALAAGQDGDDAQGQDGRQRVAAPPGGAGVRDGGQGLDQGQRGDHTGPLLGIGQEEAYPVPALSPSPTGKQP